MKKINDKPSPVHVQIVPYNQQWPLQAYAEIQRIRAAFSGNVLRIEHIGSTSVPGLAAKPIIDLMPIVADLKRLDHEIKSLEESGYKIHGACGIIGRRFCTKTNSKGERIFHVHFFREGSGHSLRHLAFRDYLRAHSMVSIEYEQEKLRAAVLHPGNSLAYNNEKSSWIKINEQRALKWWLGKHDHP